MARLLVLWLLAERAAHGYQIKRSLTDAGLAFWFGLEDASIYSVLRTLLRHGQVREVARERAGGRPTRTRYAITAAGRRHYDELLTEAIRSVRVPVAPVDVALAAVGDLDEAEAAAAWHDRRTALSSLADDIERHRSAAPSSAIADRNLALVRAEIAWLDDYLSTRTPTH